MKYILRYSLLFSVYGFIYFVIECIYKGKISDWRMFVLAGFIGVVIGLVNNLFSYVFVIVLIITITPFY